MQVSQPASPGFDPFNFDPSAYPPPTLGALSDASIQIEQNRSGSAVFTSHQPLPLKRAVRSLRLGKR